MTLQSDLSAEKLALLAERLRHPDGPLRYCLSEPLAVIGVACRFPGGANSPEAYWQLLAEGREGVTDVPRSRWDIDAFFDPDTEKPGTINTRRGGFLDDVAGFDAAFFGISPREAASMDPQQRVLLEVVWEAIERAGQDVHALSGSDTAVFIGVLGNDFALLNNRRVDRLDVYSGTGAAHNILAGRIAYLFDFHGPAVAINTACSSSLVAVHTACQSLRAGECGMAIAGGVNLMLAAESTMELSRLGVLAPDGRCKTFDARADGFVRSEGCGAVVLKRLADAIHAGDPVLAVIRSSAVNQDGRSAGLMAPNGQAQQAVVRQALANGGVAAQDVEYVETHGSGTALGDAIEVEALRAVYGETGSRPCVLGAVKTNIGHTEASAGIAGLIKAVLALGAEAIPGNLQLERVNPNLPLAGCRLELARGLRPWPRGGRRRYAALSAFGWSGTNAHVVLEEAPHREDTVEPLRSCYLLPVSGRSRDAARAMATRYAEAITADDYARVCATAGARRAHHRYRGAAVGRTVEEIRSALLTTEVGEPSDGGGVVFVYPGQGGQWAGMGRQLYEEEDVFRNVIRECAAAIHEETGWDLEASILAGADWQGIDRIQPALMALSVALTAQWRHWGIQPAVVVGHSMGEVAAAHVAGALTIEDAVRVICRRSRLLKSLAGRGGMSVVEMDADAVARAIATYDGRVSIAATNSRRSTVVSGDLEALDALGRECEAAGVYCQRVQVDVASHCAHVDGLRADLEVALRELRPQPATLPMRSTVTGALVRGDDLEARYWLKNLREPVRFVEAIEGLVAEGYRRFIEIGPHGVLIGAIEEALGRERGVVVGSLRREEHDRASLLQSLGSLYQWGANVEWRRVNGVPSRPAILPEYAWQRQQYALPDDVNEPGRRFRRGASIAGERNLHVWHLDLEDGHRVAGRDVMAGAACVEAVMRGMTEVHGEGEWEVRDVHWKELLERGREAQLVIDEDRFEVYSRGENETSWQLHADGRVVRAAFPRAAFDVDVIRARCGTRVSGFEFYDRLARQGLDYGGTYRQVRDAWVGDGEALAHLGTAKLDACLQAVSWSGPWPDGEIWVPARARRIAIGRAFTGEVWAWARWRDGAGQVVVLTGAGERVAEADGLELARLGRRDDSWLVAMDWERLDRQANNRLAGRWLIIGSSDAEALAAHLRARGAACDVATGIEAVDAPHSWRGIVWWGDEAGIEGAVALVQRMVHRGWREHPRLWLVTRGTQSAGTGVTDITGAGLWGLGRTLMYEHPEFRCTLVDTTAPIDELAAEIAADTLEDQISLRPDGRYVARLRPMVALPIVEPRVRAAGERPFRLELASPGQFDRLTWRAMARRPPRAGEVEIEIAAASINFLDVLWTLGQYPGQGTGPSVIGREFAGRVVAVGEGVDPSLRPGTAVVGCGEGCLATHVVVPAHAVATKPAQLTWEDAAGQTIAFLTAYHGLVELARLQAGERVLIHSAASGTGLAAVEIAQRIGADVWATAGTDARRASLRARGIARVMDSRSTEFVREIRDALGDRGMDVVLNSLSGDRMRASLDAVGPFGRFVELGKRDLWERTWFRTEPFRKNLAYYAVDMAAMVRDRSEAFGRLLSTVTTRLQDETWQPLPVESIEPGDVRDGFHRMASGHHRGKVVVTLAGKRTTPIARPQGVVSDDGTYLIAGGLGALGLLIGEWLIEHGARHLTLVGRHAPSVEADAALARVRTLGAVVQVCTADVADLTQVERVIASLEVPLRGVIHAAAELADATVERLSPASIARAWEPKATGAWNLHVATAGHEVDFFVVMSSVAALLGSPGQASYAAASAWADTLVEWRRRQGLPGLTIHWGPWAGVGLAAARDVRGARLADRGLESLSPQQGLAAFGRLLADDRGEAGVFRLDLRQWQQYYPKAAAAPFLQTLQRDAAAAPADHSALRATLEGAWPAERQLLIEQCIREQAARVLRLDQSKVSATAPFASLGFDSLVAIEFRNRLESILGLKLSATLVWAHPTVPELARYLAGRLNLSFTADVNEPPDDGVRAGAEEARIAALSEDAAEDELLERLKAL